jgi:hypothetical protein
MKEERDTLFHTDLKNREEKQGEKGPKSFPPVLLWSLQGYVRKPPYPDGPGGGSGFTDNLMLLPYCALSLKDVISYM